MSVKTGVILGITGVAALAAAIMFGYNMYKGADIADGTPSALPQATVDVEQNEISLEGMSVSDMVYQMMFVTPELITGVDTAIRAGEATKAALEKYPVGGIVYFAKNFKDRKQTAEMIKNTQEYSKIPLFIGVDEEGGKVARLGNNTSM